MSERQDPSLEERARIQADQKGDIASEQEAVRRAGRKAERFQENPELLDRIRQLGVDSDEYDWVEEELGPEFADIHAVANRRRSYERKAEYLDENLVERFIAENNPGRLLRQNPDMLAVAQGVHKREGKEVREPMTSDERRVARSAGEAMTNKKSLGVDNKGLEAITTATTERRTVNSQDEDRGEIRQGFSRFLNR